LRVQPFAWGQVPVIKDERDGVQIG
jgi:hypothetical protein